MTYDIIIKNNIKKCLIAFREKNDIKQKDMADALNMDYSTYRSWESGRSAPKHFMLLRLSKLMGISIDELLNGGQIADEIRSDDDDIYGDKYLSQLSREEKILVMKIRQLNTDDKTAVTDYINDLTKEL